MKHLSYKILVLICFVQRQCLVGSLSGALASKKVSEAFKGRLSTDGNRTYRIKLNAGFTANVIP